MKTKIILDTRHKNKTGLYPLKYSISVKGKTALISLGIELDVNQWDSKAERIIKHPNCSPMNMRVSRFRLDVDAFLYDSYLHGKTALQIKNMVIEHLYPKENEPITLVPIFQEYISLKHGSTKAKYQSALNRIVESCPSAKDITLNEITKEWLAELNHLLADKTQSQNGRNCYFRALLGVFNYAIDKGLTANYPFRTFKVKQTPTRKRSLSIEQLRILFSADVGERNRLAQDMFKLIFYLRGINIKDLCYLRKINDGRIEYDRFKTGKHYSVKVEPEALEIIQRYRGNDYLINALDAGKKFAPFADKVNQGLKRMCENINELPSNITTYFARHSYASIAVNDLDASFDLVSKALGHSATTGATITNVYIDFDERKVDALNRAMIDWVLYGKK